MAKRPTRAIDSLDPADAVDPFESRLAEIRRRNEDERGRRHLWHAHHWPRHYDDRCVRIGARHWCRRCLSLYPLGFVVAFLSALGLAPWPASADPAMIWLLCLPGTVAFVGEAVGVFAYRARWQMAATLVTAVAFGRALGYELVDRWSPEFWQPVALFGGIWFLASVFQHQTGR
jgi:hypothetical protein